MKFVPALRNGWTGGRYSLYRIAFGLYLAIHFAHLVPWGGELFSRSGMIPDGFASPLAGVLPNVLVVFDQPPVVLAVLALACVLSLLFAAGWRDRWVALALWYVWACLYARNPLIGNPGMPYVGWLLLAHAALPAGPRGSLDHLRAAKASRATGLGDAGAKWRLPPQIFAVAWILMVVGYTYSGLTKLASPSWLDGSAFAHVLENPLARPTWLREFLLETPVGVLQVFTWGALALEIAAAPLALCGRLRPWLWTALLAIHLGLLVLVDFADLSLGMVLLHLFTLDPAWLRRSEARQRERWSMRDGGRAGARPAGPGGEPEVLAERVA